MTRSRLWTIGLLLCVLFAGGKFGCRSLTHSTRVSRLQQIRANLNEQKSGLSKPMWEELDEQIAHAIQLAEDRKLSPVAIDTLRNRSEAALADKILVPREGEHLLALLRDFHVWQDEIHARKYMGQR